MRLIIFIVDALLIIAFVSLVRTAYLAGKEQARKKKKHGKV
jgi:hypothetical protein